MATKKTIEVRAGDDPNEFIGQLVRIPTRLVKQLPGQPRTFFGARELGRLRDSIAEIGQQQPATVIPWEDGTFRLRDGERRWRCCAELRAPLLAMVVEPKSAEEEFELSTAANMNRESHSPLEKALAMKRLRDGPLKRSALDIAKTFGVSDQTVYNHLLVLDALPQRVIDLMDPNKQGERVRTLQMSVAVRLTALTAYPKQQLQIAERIVREKLTMSHALRLIDHFADSKDIASGRGREQKPSDRLRLLDSALKRMLPHVDVFVRQQQNEIDDLFAFTPMARHEEITARLDAAIDSLIELKEKFTSVDSVGVKRGAA